MKTLNSSLLFLLLSSIPLKAVTIRLDGYLEGDVTSLEFRGDTMDYYKFEVLTTSPFRIEVVPFFEGAEYTLAQFIGLETRFNTAPLGVPRKIFPPGREGRPQFIEGIIPEGIYVLIIGAGSRNSYDIFDGFEAVNPEGGGFPMFPYQVDITGEVRGLQYWDGHLDGTFTVTNLFIPEPTTTGFLMASSLALLVRRRQSSY